MSSNMGEIAERNRVGRYNADSRRRSRHLTPSVLGVCFVMIFAWSLAVVLAPGVGASPHGATLKVPSQYPTIQSAINAAHSGDTILVAPGTYTEQLTIDKSVNLVGAGATRTFLKDAGVPYLIVIGNAATVSFSGFSVTVTTPFADAILVFDGATAAIYGNTIRAAGTGDTGIEVSYYTLGPANAVITGNQIIAATSPVDGLETGILVFGGAQATITFNSLMGPGFYGVDLEAGAVAVVEFNVVSEFSCTYNPGLVAEGLCGPSWASQVQLAGVLALNVGPGSTIAYNLVSSTDVGVFLVGCPGCVVKGNTIVNSFDYGLGGFEGTYTFGPNTVIGGAYGVAAAAAAADTTVTLSHVLIVDPSVAPLYIESDFGYTATIGGTWTVIP